MEITSEILDKYRDLEIVIPALPKRTKSAEHLRFDKDIIVAIPDCDRQSIGRRIAMIIFDNHSEGMWRCLNPLCGTVNEVFDTYAEGVDWVLENFTLVKVYSFGCYENALRFILDVVEEARKV